VFVLFVEIVLIVETVVFVLFVEIVLIVETVMMVVVAYFEL
jgi:hypothetical protein